MIRSGKDLPDDDMYMVRKLDAAPPTLIVPLLTAYDALRDTYMHGAGIGTTRDMNSVVTGIFLPSLQFREYTLVEKIDLWRGKISSRGFGLRDKLQVTDMTQQVTKIEIPACFLHGFYDFTCAYPLAKDYFEKLEAPVKGFYTEDVLAGTNTLSDAK